MQQLPLSTFNRRIGFHYYPDTQHYSQRDLETWLPELLDLGASWITLLASAERAIPEPFLNGLLSASIQPVLHFVFRLAPSTGPGLAGDRLRGPGSLQMLLNTYARWGVRFICFFDRPNCRSSWQLSTWAHDELVECFLDQFVPLAELALDEGLAPVFPPLLPGGDYWDLSFLRTALRSLQRRGCSRLLEALTLGGYGLIEPDRPLDWGSGGPERWPGARPYLTPPGLQDQRGLYIADWYGAVAQQELGRRLPVILLRGGARLPSQASTPPSQPGLSGDMTSNADFLAHARNNLGVARLAAGDLGTDLKFAPLSPELLACNFWLLAAGKGRACVSQAWFRPDGGHLPVVDALRQWVAYNRSKSHAKSGLPGGENPAPSGDAVQQMASSAPGEKAPRFHPIHHYILLPLYAWGAANWDLAAIQPLLQESHPTVGFSLAEARLAERVTVVGGEGAISVEALEMLRASGCQVERILENGTLIAT